MCLRDGGIALTRLHADAEPGRVDLVDYLELPAAADVGRALAAAVKRHGLAGWPCVCVLAPGQYQLNQVEAPAVAAGELRAAVRWRLKELLDYRVEEAVVDAFELPAARATAGQRMLFAVSAHAGVIKQLSEQVRASGLRLTAIDIPELAARNLAAQVPEQGGGVAMVLLQPRGGLITISQGDTLFLARQLDFGVEQLLDSPNVLQESLLLELQRSLDYYESQLAPAPASRILLAPMAGGRDALLDHLNGNMGVAAFRFDCGQILELEQACDEALQARAILALGGALRREAVAA